MPPKLKFAESERVLCYHGPLIYEAKCVKGQLKDKIARYLIHYNGWNKNWDEWVPEGRVMKYNEANVQKQRELREQTFKNKKARRKVNDKGTDSDKGGDKAGGESKPLKREVDSASASASASRRKKSRLNNASENEESFVARLNVKITIPDELKQWLVDDWELITRQKQLVPLPRKSTVADVLEEYVKFKAKNPEDSKPGVFREVADGIQEYFNVMLGTQLLYKFERPQYSDLLTEHENLPVSQLYGAEHLLRLFVKLGAALSYSNLDEKNVQYVVTHIQDFLEYLVKNADSLFSTDYETATPEYHRRAAT